MENSQKVYENLLSQYQGLSDLEKNAILVYKSKLFIVINSISRILEYENLTACQIVNQLSNKEECISIFNSYSKILNNLKNNFIKNTVFHNIRFDSFENFIDDLKEIISILNKISFKMILEEDTIVYRSILVDENKNFDFIDSSPFLISTSIKIEDAEKFLIDNKKKKHFYCIKLMKGIPVIVSPFSVIRKYDSLVDSLLPDSNYSLIVSDRGENGQQEIILFRDFILSNEIDSKVIHDECGDICLHTVEVFMKENVNFNKHSIIK